MPDETLRLFRPEDWAPIPADWATMTYVAAIVVDPADPSKAARGWVPLWTLRAPRDA